MEAAGAAQHSPLPNPARPQLPGYRLQEKFLTKRKKLGAKTRAAPAAPHGYCRAVLAAQTCPTQGC